jgi:hypothetical protein
MPTGEMAVLYAISRHLHICIVIQSVISLWRRKTYDMLI